MHRLSKAPFLVLFRFLDPLMNGGSVAWCSLVPFHPTSGCEDSLHEVCEKRGILGLREAMQTIIGSLRLREDFMFQNSVASGFESLRLAIEDPKPEVPQMLINL